LLLPRRVPGFNNVFASGDVASMETPKYPTGHPQVANVAITQGKLLVENPQPKIHFGGFLAWFVWMALHLFLIVGVKNRIQIFIN
jgi:NADH:quinone reductase (non-electrogenic)